MGVGGVALYSLARMAFRGLRQLGARGVQALNWTGRELLVGAALYGASFDAAPHALLQHASDRRQSARPKGER